MKRLMVLALLTLSLAACAAPSTVQSPKTPIENPTEPAAIYPAPRTHTLTGWSLFIPLKAEQRVEIEVTKNNPNASRILTIFDPYGNKIASSATILRAVGSTFSSNSIVPGQPGELNTKVGLRETSTQVYPWHYAFIAATDGNYVITTATSLELAIQQDAARSSQNVSLSEGAQYTFIATIYP